MCVVLFAFIRCLAGHINVAYNMHYKCNFKRIFNPHKSDMLKTFQRYCEIEFSECDCISFEVVGVKKRLISFEIGRNFRGHVSVFTLLLTPISITSPHLVIKPFLVLRQCTSTIYSYLQTEKFPPWS